MKKVSAVILSYHRPDNIPKILNSLEHNDLINEIIIWHCNANTPLSEKLNSPKTRIVNTDNQHGMFSRWYAARSAKNTAIYMQDDDLIVPNKVINDLYTHWRKNPQILHGLYGRDYSHNFEYKTANRYGKTDLVLTPSVIFDKKYANEMLDSLSLLEDRIRELGKKRCEDILFNFFVMSRSLEYNVAHRPSKEPIQLNTQNALSSHPEHIPERTEVLRYCLEYMIPIEMRAPISKRLSRYFQRVVSEGLDDRKIKKTIFIVLIALNILGLSLWDSGIVRGIYPIVLLGFSLVIILLIEAYLRIQHNIDQKLEIIISEVRRGYRNTDSDEE